MSQFSTLRKRESTKSGVEEAKYGVSVRIAFSFVIFCKMHWVAAMMMVPSEKPTMSRQAFSAMGRNVSELAELILSDGEVKYVPYVNYEKNLCGKMHLCLSRAANKISTNEFTQSRKIWPLIEPEPQICHRFPTLHSIA